MKKVEADRSKERRALLNSLQGREKTLTLKHSRIKEFILDEKDPRFVEGFRADLLKAEAEHKQVEADIEKLQGLIEAEKSAILLMPEFLEHMEKVAQIIATTKSMQELDFCLKKIFSNFFVDKKNVVFATLSEPFARLVDPKVSLGAP